MALSAELAGATGDAAGHSIVLGTLAWLTEPENAALLDTPEVAALASALVDSKVVSREAFSMLHALILSAPMTPEQRSVLAFRYITEQLAETGLSGSEVPLVLLPSELQTLQRMVADWDGLPEHFPMSALDALVAAGYEPALPLLRDMERRVSSKSDRGNRMLHRAFQQQILLLEAGGDPARLLAVGARADVEAHIRNWAFKRAHDLGATNEQIRAAIESLHRAASTRREPVTSTPGTHESG